MTTVDLTKFNEKFGDVVPVVSGWMTDDGRFVVRKVGKTQWTIEPGHYATALDHAILQAHMRNQHVKFATRTEAFVWLGEYA